MLGPGQIRAKKGQTGRYKDESLKERKKKADDSKPQERPSGGKTSKPPEYLSLSCGSHKGDPARKKELPSTRRIEAARGFAAKVSLKDKTSIPLQDDVRKSSGRALEMNRQRDS